MAKKDMNVPFLGSVPLETEVVTSGDDGTAVVESQPRSPAAKGFQGIVNRLLNGAQPFAEAPLSTEQTVDEGGRIGSRTRGEGFSRRKHRGWGQHL